MKPKQVREMMVGRVTGLISRRGELIHQRSYVAAHLTMEVVDNRNVRSPRFICDLPRQVVDGRGGIKSKRRAENMREPKPG